MRKLPASEDQSQKLRAIGRRLRAAREHAGLKQDELAGLLGINRRQLMRWENGSVTPSLWAIECLLDKYSIDPKWILIGPGNTVQMYNKPLVDPRYQRISDEVQAELSKLGMEVDDELLQDTVGTIFNASPDTENTVKSAVFTMLRKLSRGGRFHVS